MKKSDLKNGAVVELRNGKRCIKIDNILLIVRENSKDIFSWLKLNEYNDDLTFAYDDADKYDIVKVDNDVYAKSFLTQCCIQPMQNHFYTTSTKTDKWTWEGKKKF